MSAVQDIITSIARALGVDPKLALAIAQQESGFRPDAIGDGGHSVGLFQLNDRGEGAGMTVAQREDPAVNARIALTQVANVARQHPDWSPGDIAAAAQRPADRQGYAASINRIYGAGVASALGDGVSIPNPVDALGSAVSAVGSIVDQFNPFNVASDFATDVGHDIIQGLFRLVAYGTLFAAGAALIVAGGWRAVAPNTKPSDVAGLAAVVAA